MNLSICKMSVDVFGRQLDNTQTVKNRGLPGSPGVGFKITADDNYDLENKRLCNVANPEEQNDAATLSIVHRKLHNTIKILRKEMNDSNLLLVQGLEATIQNIFKPLSADIETTRDLAFRNAAAISNIDSRLHSRDNEYAQGNVGRGTT